MVILKLNELGYTEKSSHSVGYSRTMIQFLSGGTMELMRKQIAGYISKISWLNADLNDLYFTELHSDVKGGYFWRPSGTFCMCYSVATGERV